MPLHLIILTTRNVAATFGKNVLRTTARDVPKMPHFMLNGYMKIHKSSKTRDCNFVNASGRPTDWNTGPTVAPKDLMIPQKANIWKAGIINVHFSPKKILVKSGAIMRIPAARGIDRNAVKWNTRKKAFLNLGMSS